MLAHDKKEGWDYYSSGGDDEITLRENHSAYHRIWLKPRVMVNVKEVDVRCDVLGECDLSGVAMSISCVQAIHARCQCSSPRSRCAAWDTATARWRGQRPLVLQVPFYSHWPPESSSCCAGVIYMMPSLASRAFADMSGARLGPCDQYPNGQPLFFQLYVNPDRAVAKEMVLTAERAGCSAIFITCDAPQLGNREKDRRNKVLLSCISLL